MSRLKEICKFASGAEAFHAFVHTYFWLSGTMVPVFRLFTEIPIWHMWGAIVNAAVAVLLGIFAWRPYKRRPSDTPT